MPDARELWTNYVLNARRFDVGGSLVDASARRVYTQQSVYFLSLARPDGVGPGAGRFLTALDIGESMEQFAARPISPAGTAACTP
jgi:hypothetical protein